ncbi:hypothetical protein QUF84_04685 [Fictibacillus enclensis]|uniref:hypothetical protein n=1 Tax=Fictibacillus enclensis TaxID=1017270 RepID=UPI0025A1CB05|nr:hypothetical protein [Fictibacillus enclensis]MDM5336526.1 hypothetical protein [Fictibacillus enclensis]
MDFKQELEKLSLQLIERKSHIINEESTKQALIIPFIQKLGIAVDWSVRCETPVGKAGQMRPRRSLRRGSRRLRR